MVPTEDVVLVSYVYALSVIGGGAFGFYSKGSKASLIASTVCAIITLVLVQMADNPGALWANAVYSMLLMVMFGRKLKEPAGQSSNACPVTGDAEAAPVKEGNMMSKHIAAAGKPLLSKEEQEGADKNTQIARALFTFLTIFSLVEAGLSIQAAI